MKRSGIKGKIIITLSVVCILIAYFVFSHVWNEKQDKKTKESMNTELLNCAKEYNLKDVWIEFADDDFHQVFVWCTNFKSVEWNDVFEMYKKMSNINGVEGVVYVNGKEKYDDDKICYYPREEDDEIFAYNRTDDFYYRGSWESEDIENREKNSSYVQDFDNSENNNEDSNLKYDATLEYGSGSVLVCTSEDAMERYMTAANNDNEGTLDELQRNNQIAYVSKGTKCNIVKKKFTKCQVKILEGAYEGNTVWVVIEAVHEK